MEFFHTVLEMLASAARGIWPGVLGAVGLGYLGSTYLGFPGFLIGAAVGALAGTWIGVRLDLVPIKQMTDSATNDQLLHAVGAWLLVVAGYFMLQFFMLIGAVLAIAALALIWVQS